MKSDLVDIRMRRFAETELAVLFSPTDKRDDATWLPKSEIEYNRTSQRAIYDVTMPEWLAVEKGLVL
jgi:hypothetical protein